jgi:hypothetical protein
MERDLQEFKVVRGLHVDPGAARSGAPQTKAQP